MALVRTSWPLVAALLLPLLASAGCLDWNEALLRPDGRVDAGQPDLPADVSSDSRTEAGPDAPTDLGDAGDGAADAAADGASDAASDGASDGTDAAVMRANGAACASDGVCASGHCADQVCCNTACTDACRTCKQTATLGQCVPIAEGQTPAGSGKSCPTANPCGGDGRCDGRGACRNRPAGESCQGSSCSGTVFTLAKICDGKGACALATTQPQISCEPYECDSSTKLCRYSCTKNNECSVGTCSGLLCNGQQRPLGAICGSSTECASNFCAGGFCCESACDGLCETCAWPGAEGRCINVPAGRPAAPGSCTVSAPCGADGSCDGQGGCRLAPSGTPCQATECAVDVAGDALRQHRCDGLGACKPTDTSCGAYRCQPGQPSCYGRCETSAQCKTGSCVGGSCS